MAGGGVRNPPSRGAVCEQHKHGSVGAGAGNRPGYPTIDLAQDVVAPPDPELVERARRRRFSAEYKLRILREADACSKPGEIGVLLRREGLYSSLLTEWRRQRERGSLEALERPRGRPKADPREAQIAGLQRRLERAERELEKARRVIEVQGNVSALLGDLLEPRGAQGSTER
jgi:transposase-like protein